jgi:hypothetical protein
VLSVDELRKEEADEVESNLNSEGVTREASVSRDSMDYAMRGRVTKKTKEEKKKKRTCIG